MNKHDMPFASFIGVNHQGSPFFWNVDFFLMKTLMHSSGYFKVGYVVCHTDLPKALPQIIVGQ